MRIAGQRPNGSFRCCMACGRRSSRWQVSGFPAKVRALAWSESVQRFAPNRWPSASGDSSRSLETTGQKAHRVGSREPLNLAIRNVVNRPCLRTGPALLAQCLGRWHGGALGMAAGACASPWRARARGFNALAWRPTGALGRRRGSGAAGWAFGTTEHFQRQRRQSATSGIGFSLTTLNGG